MAAAGLLLLAGVSNVPSAAAQETGSWVLRSEGTDGSGTSTWAGGEATASGGSATHASCYGGDDGLFTANWSWEAPPDTIRPDEPVVVKATPGATSSTFTADCNVSVQLLGSAEGSFTVDQFSGGPYLGLSGTCDGPDCVWDADSAEFTEVRITAGSGQEGASASFSWRLQQAGPQNTYTWTYEWVGESGAGDAAPEVAPTDLAADESAPQESGVIERDGNLYLNAPPGGVLELTREDLPEWARGQVAVEGAMIVTVGPPDYIAGGDSTVLIDGRPVARIDDPTVQGGVIVEASDQIFVNGVAVAVVGSQTVNPMMTALVPHVGGPVVQTHGLSKEEAARRAELIANQPPLTEADGRILDRWYELRQAYEWQKRKVWLARNDFYVEQIRLELEEVEILVSAILFISDPYTGNSEMVRVAGKGSIILEEPLQHDYPAGSFIVSVDDETTALLNEATAADGSDGPATSDTPDSSGSSLPVVFGVLALVAAAAAGGLLWKRRSSAS